MFDHLKLRRLKNLYYCTANLGPLLRTVLVSNGSKQFLNQSKWVSKLRTPCFKAHFFRTQIVVFIEEPQFIKNSVSVITHQQYCIFFKGLIKRVLVDLLDKY